MFFHTYTLTHIPYLFTMILSREEKIFFLSLVNDNKELLFGAFDAVHITAESKKLTWESIRTSLLSRGVKCPQDAAHLRGVGWSNFKRATLTKVDANKKTGAGGGKLLTEVDDMVVKLLGKNSQPYVEFLVFQSDHQIQTKVKTNLKAKKSICSRSARLVH